MKILQIALSTLTMMIKDEENAIANYTQLLTMLTSTEDVKSWNKIQKIVMDEQRHLKIIKSITKKTL